MDQKPEKQGAKVGKKVHTEPNARSKYSADLIKRADVAIERSRRIIARSKKLAETV